MSQKFQFQYATFVERLGCDLIDGVIALLITLPFWLVVDKLILNSGFNLFSANPKSLGFSHIILWGVFLYNMTYLVGKYGQSWGRRTLNLKVVNKEGEPIGFWIALIRNLIAIFFSSILCLGFLWILIDKRNQAWHDKIMNTFVVSMGD